MQIDINECIRVYREREREMKRYVVYRQYFISLVKLLYLSIGMSEKEGKASKKKKNEKK